MLLCQLLVQSMEVSPSSTVQPPPCRPSLSATVQSTAVTASTLGSSLSLSSSTPEATTAITLPQAALPLSGRFQQLSWSCLVRNLWLQREGREETGTGRETERRWMVERDPGNIKSQGMETSPSQGRVELRRSLIVGTTFTSILNRQDTPKTRQRDQMY